MIICIIVVAFVTHHSKIISVGGVKCIMHICICLGSRAISLVISPTKTAWIIYIIIALRQKISNFQLYDR